MERGWGGMGRGGMGRDGEGWGGEGRGGGGRGGEGGGGEGGGGGGGGGEGEEEGAVVRGREWSREKENEGERGMTGWGLRKRCSMRWHTQPHDQHRHIYFSGKTGGEGPVFEHLPERGVQTTFEHLLKEGVHTVRVNGVRTVKWRLCVHSAGRRSSRTPTCWRARRRSQRRSWPSGWPTRRRIHATLLHCRASTVMWRPACARSVVRLKVRRPRAATTRRSGARRSLPVKKKKKWVKKKKKRLKTSPRSSCSHLPRPSSSTKGGERRHAAWSKRQ